MKHVEDATMFADDSYNLSYFLVVLFACIIELATFLLGKNLNIFLAVHLCVSVALTLFVYYVSVANRDKRIPLLLWIGIVLFGPLGSIGMLCFFLFYKIFKRLSTPFEKWYDALFPDMPLSPAGKIYERIIAGWDDYKTQREVISFQDLMQVGSVEQKQTALEMIAQNFNPMLAPILKKALEDPSNQIRVQAASIMAKIEREFELKKKELLGALEKDPNDPESLLALAEHLDAYAFSGVIDFFREKESREMAIEYYKKYIDQKPDDHNAWVALGRLLNRLHAFDQVMEWFEQRAEKFATIPSSSYAWYWEALYMLHSYNKLSESAQKVYREMIKTNTQQDLLECVKLWVKPQK